MIALLLAAALAQIDPPDAEERLAPPASTAVEQPATVPHEAAPQEVAPAEPEGATRTEAQTEASLDDETTAAEDNDPAPLPRGRHEEFVPVRLSIGPADLGQLPEVAPASRLLVTQKLGALIATKDLFGTILLETQLRGTVILTQRLWLDVVLPFVEYRQVINASLTASKIAFGNVSGTISYTLHENAAERFTFFGRVLLPTSTEYRQAQLIGFEAGLASGVHLRRWLDFMGGIHVPMTYTILGGRVLPKVMPTISTDVDFKICSGFSVVAGVELRLGISDLVTLEHFAPKMALRFYPVPSWLLELKGLYVLAGAERMAINAALTTGLAF